MSKVQVETAEQCHTLQQFGYETAQGYLFSKPVSSDELTQLLNRHVKPVSER